MLPDLAAPGLIIVAPVVHLPITASPIVIPSASSKSAEWVVACLLRSSSPTASPRTPSPSLPTPLPSEHGPLLRGIQFKKGQLRAASTSSVPLLPRACTISGCSRAAPAAVEDGWRGAGTAAPRRPCRAQPHAAPPLTLHSLPVAWSLDSCRCPLSGEAAGGEPNDPEQRAKPRKADRTVMHTFCEDGGGL